MKKYLVLILALTVLLTGCNSIEPLVTEPQQYQQPLVEKVEGLSDDFLLGADISSLIALENSGLVYHNFSKQPRGGPSCPFRTVQTVEKATKYTVIANQPKGWCGDPLQ